MLTVMAAPAVRFVLVREILPPVLLPRTGLGCTAEETSILELTVTAPEVVTLTVPPFPRVSAPPEGSRALVALMLPSSRVTSPVAVILTVPPLPPAVESIAARPPLASIPVRSPVEPIVRPPPVRLRVMLPPFPGLSFPKLASAAEPGPPGQSLA